MSGHVDFFHVLRKPAVEAMEGAGFRYRGFATGPGPMGRPKSHLELCFEAPDGSRINVRVEDCKP